MARPPKPGTGITNKRRRELAAAKLERQTARRMEQATRTRRRRRIGWAIAALVGVCLVSAAAILPRMNDTSTDVAAHPVSGCDTAPTAKAASPGSWKVAPEPALAKDTAYTLVLATNCGDIAISTTPDKAPATVNSQLFLASQGWFNDSPCHRLTTDPIFVLQCGDPTGTGSGNAGYTIQDENLPEKGENNYPRGTVAMANGGANTSSSQFFIVYKDTTLPPSYSVWGTVTEGMDIIDKIAEKGVSGGGTDGAPEAPLGIIATSVEPPLN